LVSTIIPVYNGERTLGPALDSAAAQDYRPLEVIVIDDGSTDGTADIARRYDVRYAYQPNQGSAAARNAGILAAQGELLAFLDADDLWTPDKLRVQVAYLLEHPDLGYVLAHMRVFLEPGTSWPASLNRAYYEHDPTGYLPSTLLARREVFDRVGGFDTSFRTSQDSDWFLRAHDAGIAMAVVPEVLLNRRLHDANRTNDTQAVTLSLLRAVRASLERRRQA
jgi:glycosyltransferase involved in cell wall biosynthesis